MGGSRDAGVLVAIRSDFFLRRYRSRSGVSGKRGSRIAMRAVIRWKDGLSVRKYGLNVKGMALARVVHGINAPASAAEESRLLTNLRIRFSAPTRLQCAPHNPALVQEARPDKWSPPN
jgi:hypothetical protein